MKKSKKIVIKIKDVLKKIRKPVPKPSAVHKKETAYNRKKSKIVVKKILKGIKDEKNNS